MIFVFTMDGCIHCKNLKSKLKQEKINFYELEVSENEVLWESILEITKEDVLPTILIKQEIKDTGIILVPGVDFFSENEAIELIRKKDL